jgi:hypothetical protein
MRRLFFYAFLLILGGAIAGAITYSQSASARSSGPQAAPVLEQNVDANGFIRIHEQGTAEVHVTNTSLPVTGTVNVGNLPTDAGRVIRLSDAFVYAPHQSIQTSAIDTSDCRALVAYVAQNAIDSAGDVAVQPTLLPTPTGSGFFGGFEGKRQFNTFTYVVPGTDSMPVVAPKVVVELRNGTSDIASTDGAWLYCAH